MKSHQTYLTFISVIVLILIINIYPAQAKTFPVTTEADLVVEINMGNGLGAYEFQPSSHYNSI